MDENRNYSNGTNTGSSDNEWNSSDAGRYAYEQAPEGDSGRYTGPDTGETGNGSYQYSSSGNRFYQDDSYYDTEQKNFYYTGGSDARQETSGSGTADSSDPQDASGGAGPRKPAGKKSRKEGGKGKAVLALALAAVFGISVGAGVWGASNYAARSAAPAQAVEEAQTEEGDQAPAQAEQEAAAEEPAQKDKAEQSTDAATAMLSVNSSDTVNTSVTQVASDVMPSIVSVYNNFTQATQYFGQTYTEEATSTGSGIIVAMTDDELLIVTNNHVVENADSLSVQFIDQQNAEAAIKGTDPSNDLAVIAVSLDGLSKDTLDTIRVATLGDSDKLQIGEPAIAIGNALGYGQSVTVGYISAINREIRDENGASGTFIQTDAAINPGNSGGALVNINGEVIGINSSKIGGAAVEGMGFAIPTTKALPIIEELMNQTTRTKVADDKQGTLGISGVSVTENVSSAYDIPVGVYVAEILENGGAAASDLQKGDIITAIDGTSVGDMEGLKKQLTFYEAGTEVTVTVQRQARNGGYETKDIKITLGNRDSLNSGSKESGGTGSLFQPGQGDSDDSSIGG